MGFWLAEDTMRKMTLGDVADMVEDAEKRKDWNRTGEVLAFLLDLTGVYINKGVLYWKTENVRWIHNKSFAERQAIALVANLIEAEKLDKKIADVVIQNLGTLAYALLNVKDIQARELLEQLRDLNPDYRGKTEHPVGDSKTGRLTT